MSGKRQKVTGFTLIELLVVIGVIAIIAALLFPAFATVRERGRRTTCLSNLRQIALAMQQYVQDASGAYPLAFSTENRGGVIYSVDWDDAIYPYVKNAQIFICPDQPADAPWAAGNPQGTAGLRYTDYTYNMQRLNVFVPPYPTKNVYGIHESSFATPSTIWLTVDAMWSDTGGEVHYGRSVPHTSCGQQTSGSTLHWGGGDYSFTDGHVQWLTPEAAGEVECKNGPLPPPFVN